MKCVIASQRPWQRDMAESLQRATGHEFTLISDPEKFNIQTLSEINPKYVFLPHWSHRVEAKIHQRYECIIFHMTDVPFGRGGSPLQNLIARGIYETRVSAIRCVEELDAGPVYLKRPLSLYGAAEEIFLRASKVMEEMIAEIVLTEPRPKDQHGTPTVFKRRTPEQGDLGKAKTLDEIFDLIRMLDADGYPRAFVNCGGFKIEFARASRKVGSVVADVRIFRSPPHDDDDAK